MPLPVADMGLTPGEAFFFLVLPPVADMGLTTGGVWRNRAGDPLADMGLTSWVLCCCNAVAVSGLTTGGLSLVLEANTV